VPNHRYVHEFKFSRGGSASHGARGAGRAAVGGGSAGAAGTGAPVIDVEAAGADAERRYGRLLDEANNPFKQFQVGHSSCLKYSQKKIVHRQESRLHLLVVVQLVPIIESCLKCMICVWGWDMPCTLMSTTSTAQQQWTFY
jgi:hypothetical protein